MEKPPIAPRYEILECIGRGGMGTVHRAYDRVLGEDVALKTLHNADPAMARALKDEFRSLAGVVHRNLVLLYELEVTPERSFFTMELVDGVHLLDYVHPGVSAADRATRAPDEARLRSCARQLAEGICALHAARRLHLDIKPSNVMVTREGRVVILDFGLATAVDEQLSGARRAAIGSPIYMSPEQGREQETLSEASDWYSFGVVLHEALAGRPPFQGTQTEVTLAKRGGDARPPSAMRGGVPRDLDELCAKLLRRAPIARPTGEEVLAALGDPAATSGPAPQSAAPRFVGRRRELAMLDEALAAAGRGSAVTVHVHGASGIGKSALVERFLDRIERRALVLKGRCYERESVPYKAIDGLIDGIGRFLATLPEGEAAALIPENAHLLARVFPSLPKIGAFGEAPPSASRAQDPQELRRRAFGALGELLQRLARRAPLVLAIDDLQWGDADSAAVFTDVLRASPAFPALLLLIWRSGDARTSPLLRVLLGPHDDGAEGGPLATDEGSGARGDLRELHVGPLSDEESCELTLGLLDEGPAGAEELAHAIARDAAGSPFFLREIAEHTRLHGADAEARPVRVEEIVRERVAGLGGDARRLLEAIAIAGYPLREATAVQASGIPRAARAALEILRASRLVLARGAGSANLLEPYHDRIRETIVARLDPSARRDLHRRLAEVLAAAADPDPQRLVEHYQAAGVLDRAAHFAVIAGDRAAEALAFNRAASLYQLALEHRAAEAGAWRMRRKLGEALSSAGRGGEAAESFARAAADLGAEGSGDPERFELERLAAEQYLRSGFVEDGMKALRKVLSAAGVRYPETPARAVASVLIRRAELKIRGLSFEPRDAGAIDAADRARLEACWSAGLGLSMLDTIRSADFQIRHQLLALRAGDPIHVARGLTTQVAFLASEGGAENHGKCREILAGAERLAARVDDPSLLALVHLCGGVAAYFRNDYRVALDQCRTAERICRDRCRGVAWEITNTQLYGLWALGYLGEIAELSRQLPRTLKDARERGDLFAATSLRLGVPNMVWLAADRPDEAREQADDAMHSWTPTGFHTQHYFELLAQAQIDLYRGDPWAAWRRVRDTWPRLKKAHLLRLQSIRIELCHLRARCALAAASTPNDALAAGSEPDRKPDRAGLLAEAAKRAAEIDEERSAWSGPLAAAIRAGIAATKGSPEAALRALDDAARGFDALEMRLYAESARLLRGAISGGETGRTERERSAASMRSEGVTAPARMVSTLIPGFALRG